MAIDVRIALPDEYAGLVEVLGTAFLDRPDVAREAEFLREPWAIGRTWGAFEGTRACGTFRGWPTELTVPGGARVPAAAVSAVAVLPTHRRRGILTALAAREDAAAREAGEVVSLLYASEYGIYGRFGWGPATRTGLLTIDTRRTTVRAAAGGVELAAPDEALRDALRAVHEEARTRRAGELLRLPWTWDVRLGLVEEPWDGRWKGLVAVHRDAAGAVDGYARYRTKADWSVDPPAGNLDLDELCALTDEAYGALWRYLAEIDLVTALRAHGRPLSERVAWLLADGRAARWSGVGDALWVRLVDVPAALAARSYERTARLVLEVHGGGLPGGRVRVALEADPGGATARPTAASPDLVLPAHALGAAYLGGTRLRDAVAAAGCDEPTPGALAAADALFRTADDPWCSTFF